MSTVTVQIPDDLAAALQVPAEEIASRLLLAAAVQWFALGAISAGKAAELAGLPKPLFLGKLAECGVSASTLTPDDIAHDVANA